MLFPLADYWWFYVAFTGFILVLLAVDLGVFNRKAHVVSIREAAKFSAIWISLALIFNVAAVFLCAVDVLAGPAAAGDAGLRSAQAAAWRVALEFLAGYVVEYTLSVDNMFVFVVIFSFFGVPSLYQHRVLFYGILGALIFRAIFIALGVRAAVVPLGDRAVRRAVDLHRLQDARARFGGDGSGQEPAGAADPPADAGVGPASTARTSSRASTASGMRRRCSWR